MEREFPAAVAGSSLRLWRPGDPLSDHGTRILIGIATWSGYDMRLLDVVEEGMARGSAPAVAVFNTSDCRTQDDFNKYVPGLGAVYQTPVVGIWQDGRLEWSGQGAEARERVARLFGSGPDEIGKYVGDRMNAERNARTA
ncbi:MAG TPA: hypothetical protein VJ739_05985 [Gemmataceae bacterium]|nr:hypothetical protein [Gemmataceae bacterium]